MGEDEESKGPTKEDAQTFFETEDESEREKIGAKFAKRRKALDQLRERLKKLEDTVTGSPKEEAKELIRKIENNMKQRRLLFENTSDGLTEEELEEAYAQLNLEDKKDTDIIEEIKRKAVKKQQLHEEKLQKKRVVVMKQIAQIVKATEKFEDMDEHQRYKALVKKMDRLFGLIVENLEDADAEPDHQLIAEWNKTAMLVIRYQMKKDKLGVTKPPRPISEMSEGEIMDYLPPFPDARIQDPAAVLSPIDRARVREARLRNDGLWEGRYDPTPQHLPPGNGPNYIEEFRRKLIHARKMDPFFESAVSIDEDLMIKSHANYTISDVNQWGPPNYQDAPVFATQFAEQNEKVLDYMFFGPFHPYYFLNHGKIATRLKNWSYTTDPNSEIALLVRGFMRWTNIIITKILPIEKFAMRLRQMATPAASERHVEQEYFSHVFEKAKLHKDLSYMLEPQPISAVGDMQVFYDTDVVSPLPESPQDEIDLLERGAELTHVGKGAWELEVETLDDENSLYAVDTLYDFEIDASHASLMLAAVAKYAGDVGGPREAVELEMARDKWDLDLTMWAGNRWTRKQFDAYWQIYSTGAPLDRAEAKLLDDNRKRLEMFDEWRLGTPSLNPFNTRKAFGYEEVAKLHTGHDWLLFEDHRMVRNEAIATVKHILEMERDAYGEGYKPSMSIDRVRKIVVDIRDVDLSSYPIARKLENPPDPIDSRPDELLTPQERLERVRRQWDEKFTFARDQFMEAEDERKMPFARLDFLYKRKYLEYLRQQEPVVYAREQKWPEDVIETLADVMENDDTELIRELGLEYKEMGANMSVDTERYDRVLEMIRRDMSEVEERVVEEARIEEEEEEKEMREEEERRLAKEGVKTFAEEEAKRRADETQSTAENVDAEATAADQEATSAEATGEVGEEEKKEEESKDEEEVVEKTEEEKYHEKLERRKERLMEDPDVVAADPKTLIVVRQSDLDKNWKLTDGERLLLEEDELRFYMTKTEMVADALGESEKTMAMEDSARKMLANVDSIDSLVEAGADADELESEAKRMEEKTDGIGAELAVVNEETMVKNAGEMGNSLIMSSQEKVSDGLRRVVRQQVRDTRVGALVQAFAMGSDRDDLKTVVDSPFAIAKAIGNSVGSAFNYASKKVTTPFRSFGAGFADGSPLLAPSLELKRRFPHFDHERYMRRMRLSGKLHHLTRCIILDNFNTIMGRVSKEEWDRFLDRVNRRAVKGEFLRGMLINDMKLKFKRTSCELDENGVPYVIYTWKVRAMCWKVNWNGDMLQADLEGKFDRSRIRQGFDFYVGIGIRPAKSDVSKQFETGFYGYNTQIVRTFRVFPAGLLEMDRTPYGKQQLYDAEGRPILHHLYKKKLWEDSLKASKYDRPDLPGSQPPPPGEDGEPHIEFDENGMPIVRDEFDEDEDDDPNNPYKEEDVLAKDSRLRNVTEEELEEAEELLRKHRHEVLKKRSEDLYDQQVLQAAFLAGGTKLKFTEKDRAGLKLVADSKFEEWLQRDNSLLFNFRDNEVIEEDMEEERKRRRKLARQRRMFVTLYPTGKPKEGDDEFEHIEDPTMHNEWQELTEPLADEILAEWEASEKKKLESMSAEELVEYSKPPPTDGMGVPRPAPDYVEKEEEWEQFKRAALAKHESEKMPERERLIKELEMVETYDDIVTYETQLPTDDYFDEDDLPEYFGAPPSDKYATDLNDELELPFDAEGNNLYDEQLFKRVFGDDGEAEEKSEGSSAKQSQT